MKFCNKKNGWCGYYLYLISFMFIIVYGIVINNKMYPDILENKFCKCEGCDYWALTHFMLNFLLAYYIPDGILFWFIIGTCYEFFEHHVGSTDNVIKKYVGSISSDGDQSWWYGRSSDIFFNSLGLLTGYMLSKHKPKITFIKCNRT